MQIRFFTKEGWQGNQFHFHDQMEILLMMSEGGNFHIRNMIYPITRGSLFVLSPEDLHRSAPCSQSLHQFYSIRFYPEDVNGFSSPEFNVLSCFQNHDHFQFRVQLYGDQLDHLLKIINKMEYYLSVDCSAYGKEVYVKALLAETLVYVNFLYKAPIQSPHRDNQEISNLLPVFHYIRDHIDENLSLDILAKQIFVNKYYLSHRFKQVMGFPLSEYITRSRLSAAKNLLRQGYSVTVAGERSGFNSSAHFIRTFVKTVGVSPKQYAKQYATLENYDSPSPIHRDAFSVSSGPISPSPPEDPAGFSAPDAQ